MTEPKSILQFPQAPDAPSGCPNCESHRVETEIREQHFEYGLGREAVTLSAAVPVRRCLSCGFEFTDDVGETLRHDAVCRHLGVMTPAEVESVRRRLKLNRAEFARLTGLGEASLARWESGALIQNPANDALLYLLTFPDNAARLKSREEWRSREIEPSVIDGACRFRSVVGLDRLRAEAALFQLRRT